MDVHSQVNSDWFLSDLAHFIAICMKGHESLYKKSEVNQVWDAESKEHKRETPQINKKKSSSDLRNQKILLSHWRHHVSFLIWLVSSYLGHVDAPQNQIGSMRFEYPATKWERWCSVLINIIAFIIILKSIFESIRNNKHWWNTNIQGIFF